MTETVAGEVTLTANEEESFKMFRQWMHTHTLYNDGQNLEVKNYNSCAAFFQGYVFADSKGIPAMKNDIIDYLIDQQRAQHIIPTSHFKYVWAHTVERDGLRKLFFDFLMMTGLKQGFFHHGVGENFPKELLLNIVATTLDRGYTRVIRTQAEWKASKCQYHDHSDQTSTSSLAEK
jgi:hypothetical protein